MTINLKEVTEEQLEKLIKLCETDKELGGIYWQLRGIWMMPWDDDPIIIIDN